MTRASSILPPVSEPTIRRQEGHPDPWHLMRPDCSYTLMFRDRFVAERAKTGTLAEALTLRWAQYQTFAPLDFLDAPEKVSNDLWERLLYGKAVNNEPRTELEEEKMQAILSKAQARLRRA